MKHNSLVLFPLYESNIKKTHSHKVVDEHKSSVKAKITEFLKFLLGYRLKPM